MKKFIFNIFILFNLLLISNVYSQVGINISDPQATLDIQTSANTDATKSLRIRNSSNKDLFTITDIGRFGLDVEDPESQLHVSYTEMTGIIADRYATDAAASYLVLRKNRSVDALVNGAILANDEIGAISFQGNTGNGYSGDLKNSHASIFVKATQNFTETARGSAMLFRTVSNSTATSLNRMIISSQGLVGIGTDTPLGQLHVSTTAANGIISERHIVGTPTPSYLTLRKNRSNNPLTNVAVLANDVIGVVTFAGNTGSGYEGDPYNSKASVEVRAAENFTPTRQGSTMIFNTVAIGTALTIPRITISSQGLVGIGRAPATNMLEINGQASKVVAGSWVANSDARLKQDIKPILGEEALNKLTKLEGVTYYWNDDKTGIDRPKEKQIGFTAQNIQKVFPEKVTTDAQGYLQTAYGDYDAIFVESIKALNDKIIKLTDRLEKLEKENKLLKQTK